METNNRKQLVTQDNGNIEKIFPKNYMSNIVDEETGESLRIFLLKYNHIDLGYRSSKSSARLAVPIIMRRKGLYITYYLPDDVVITEFFNGNKTEVSDTNWVKDELWVKDVNELNVYDFKISDGSITLDKLSEEVMQLISSKGDITINNFPDNEDLELYTIYQDSNNKIDAIRFKDRDNSNGMAYKYLRKTKNMILSQSDFNQANAIYEIRYDFDLNSQTITIPEGCILRFNGGSISNGIINFSNTTLSGDINITSNVTGNILNNFANIIWFGAKENTDSTHAIQNAINVCNRVYIPKVSEGALFIIQEDIYINKPTQIYGELGNKIGNLEDIATLTLFKVVNTEHVYFYNLNLTNGTASTEKVTREISGAINIDNCTDIIIDNCKIDNIFGHWGVKVRNTTDIKVEHTSFSNITYNMLFFEEGCRNILVNNSSFINVTSLYEADRKYMISTGVTNYTDPFPLRVDNFKVINCYFENNSFWEAIDSHGGTNIFIENNIIKDCAIGIAVNADNRPALSIPTDNVIIQNNYIKGWTDRENYFGINATSGVYDYFGTNYYIANNIIIDYNTDNNNISGAIRLVGLRNATVINNTVRATSNVVNRIYNGIYLVTCLDSVISENNVSNCIYGIRSERGDYNIKITSNVFKDLDRANIVINNTYSGLLDISENITTPTNSGDAVFTNSTNCTGIKTNWIIGRKGFFIRTLDQRPLFAYTHDNIKRNGLTVNVLLTVSSTGELRVKDETIDLLRYIAESESLTLNSTLTSYPVIIDKFISPYKAQILNWTGGDVEIESITYDTCECVSVTSEVRDSAINLNDVFVGYEYFNRSTNQIMTKDNNGIWLNMDGTLYSRVKILSNISQLSSIPANTIYKIVSDIDLQGKTLTIPANCTLDFQGGSFSNGTIVGSNTRFSGNIKLDTTLTFSGTYLLDTVNVDWFYTNRGLNASPYIQAALDFAKLIKASVTFGNKLTSGYIIKTTLNCDVPIIGNNARLSSTTVGVLNCKNECSIENLYIDFYPYQGASDVTDNKVIAINIGGETSTYNHYINNVTIDGFYYGIVMTNSWNLRCSNLRIIRTRIGIQAYGKCVNNSIVNANIDCKGTNSICIAFNDEVDHAASTYLSEGWTISNSILTSAQYGIFGVNMSNTFISNCIIDLCSKNAIKFSLNSLNIRIVDNYLACLANGIDVINFSGQNVLNNEDAGIIISNNTIKSYYSDSGSCNGINIGEGTYESIYILGNTISNLGGIGIVSLNGEITHINVSDNRFKINVGGYFYVLKATNKYIANNNAIDNYNNSGIKVANKMIIVADSAPTSNTKTWNAGDICLNSNASVGSIIGWFCATSGSPGTWFPIGTIEQYAGLKKQGTTAERPAMNQNYIGATYYDTTLKKMILWNGTTWTNVDGTALT